MTWSWTVKDSDFSHLDIHHYSKAQFTYPYTDRSTTTIAEGDYKSKNNPVTFALVVWFTSAGNPNPFTSSWTETCSRLCMEDSRAATIRLTCTAFSAKAFPFPIL